ncbi:Imm61 family immunity protein [Demequina muriae]|uniref:Imm61 family immunity protein n=1 Tax=Demequina muriae TaxID=3051664 RepID=A0ABT8GFY9_9MICO|nr:Imm61 family immunity protein [Demequina sp. EGI L300058]MDN4480279.1 Imm61 family immunity protein [Demequina sp. EGI L300058]
MNTEVLTALSAWAAQAGYRRLVDDSSVVIADEGGEIRFYVRNEDGQWMLSRAERAEDETVLMVATELPDIERHLAEQIGWDVRSQLGLAQILLPYEIDDLADGYRINEVGDGWAELVDSTTGHAVACFLHTSVPYRAVRFSWYADTPPETLRTWFTDPRGGPRLQRFLAGE